MNIEIKKSTKPVKYIDAIEILEKRVIDVSLKKKNELIWILEHPSTFTAGKRYCFYKSNPRRSTCSRCS